MKIAIDARFYGGEKAKGLGRYTQKLIFHLQEIDRENDYFILLQHEDYEKITFTNKKFQKVLADFHWYTLKEQIRMPRLLKKLQPDITHFPHYNVPFFFRKKFIVTIHDLILHHFPTKRATTLPAALYFFKQLGYKAVIRHAVQAAKKVITVSQFSKKDILETFHIPAGKVAVTYEGVDRPPERRTDPAILKKYHIQKPYILYVGNAYPHKNLEILLDVVSEMKRTGEMDWSLVLVGKEEFFYKRLKEEARSKNVLDKVLFTGFVPDEHLSTLYQHATAYIFPSLYEGFGLPPLESMAHGTPVLAANSSSLPEILQDKVLYFDPGDKNGIIKVLKALLSSAELRQKMSAEGKKYTKVFDWRKMAQETYKIYENCGR
ncbi:MAG: hypothetical protein A3F54_04715 [Candidatus Kerfeldbacteria bacterium RIFCSPHIGHO2_12_FULL_48_17]|uniref:Glycosyl transferase family 1 n=1 Tax=Candidatus Kerfeldbacteria bacterium RIFCSPHIGHO2_12_FULL_48_17 TaxID=1798542 RepID=A0A1G2AY60_9BACT|nr:MAG: hypothetical protein A3F54_04715 [Candidatus Kerfeldbacteria bacterium RIFCSPHIGHO2_12_FULL_48_17]